jgi:hypothetical protein
VGARGLRLWRRLWHCHERGGNRAVYPRRDGLANHLQWHPGVFAGNADSEPSFRRANLWRRGYADLSRAGIGRHPGQCGKHERQCSDSNGAGVKSYKLLAW